LAAFKRPTLADGSLPWQSGWYQYGGQYHRPPGRELCSILLDAAIWS